MLHNRANSLKRICQIDVSAFASIMFVLVFTMMVAEVSARPPHGAGVDLPKVWHPVGIWRADREDAFTVGIRRDGKVFFRNEMVAPNELAAKIKVRLNQGSERKLYIRADAHIGYGRVGAVLDEVRSSGVEEITFHRRRCGVSESASWLAAVCGEGNCKIMLVHLPGEGVRIRHPTPPKG